MSYFLMFAVSFLAVFLLGLQSRIVNRGLYGPAIVVSFGISVANFAFVKYAAAGDLVTFFLCAGIASSIWFSKNVVEKRLAQKAETLTVKVEIDTSQAIAVLDTLAHNVENFKKSMQRMRQEAA